MLFQRINRTQAEAIFTVVYNVSGSTITQGYSAVLDVGASVDGVRVTQASTADLQAFIGVADKDIASLKYGLLQVYGYRTDVYIYSSTGSSASGDELVVVQDKWGLTPQLTTFADTHKHNQFQLPA